MSFQLMDYIPVYQKVGNHSRKSDTNYDVYHVLLDVYGNTVLKLLQILLVYGSSSFALLFSIVSTIYKDCCFCLQGFHSPLKKPQNWNFPDRGRPVLRVKLTNIKSPNLVRSAFPPYAWWTLSFLVY